jgi:hypothetical protein
MISWAVQVGDITQQDLIDLQNSVGYLKGLHNDLTCHEVCQFLIEQPDLNMWNWVKGKFNHFDHSWLKNSKREVILDPYPWCSGSGPLLIYVGGVLNPWRKLYQKANQGD